MKYLLVLLLTGSVLFVNAQDQIGNWILGGSMGYNHSKVDGLMADPGPYNSGVKTISNVIVFQPYFGKAVNDRWILGLTTSYELDIESSDFYEDNRTSKSTTHSGGLGVFARYLFNPGHRLLLYIEPSASVGRSETKWRERNEVINSFNRTSFSFNITPVITYPLGSCCNLVGKLNPLGFEFGSIQADDEAGKTQYSNFDGVVSLSGIQLGVEWRF